MEHPNGGFQTWGFSIAILVYWRVVGIYTICVICIYIYIRCIYMVGSLPVVNRIVTPRSKIIFPVTQLEGPFIVGLITHIYNDRFRAHLVPLYICI